MKFLFAWIATAVVFVGLDAMWLSQVAPHLDPPIIGELLSNKVEMAPAIAFYLLYITGLVILVSLPAAEKGSLKRALLYGAIFGLVAYGTYDLTNQATLRVWSTTITLADMGWGAVASAVGAAAGYVAAARAKR